MSDNYYLIAYEYNGSTPGRGSRYNTVSSREPVEWLLDTLDKGRNVIILWATEITPNQYTALYSRFNPET